MTLIEKIDQEIRKVKAKASIGGDHTAIVSELTGLRTAKKLILAHVEDNSFWASMQEGPNLNIVEVEDLV